MALNINKNNDWDDNSSDNFNDDYNDNYSNNYNNNNSIDNGTVSEAQLNERDYYMREYGTDIDQIDNDNIFQETWQILVGDQFTSTYTTAKKTLLGEEAEMVDYGIHNKYESSFFDKDGWGKLESSVDALAGVSSIVGAGLILTGVGAGVGAWLLGTGLSSTLAKGLAKTSMKMKKIHKIAEKTIAKVTPDLIEGLAKTDNEEMINGMLQEVLGESKSAKIVDDKGIDLMSGMLKEVDDVEDIDKMVKHFVEDGYLKSHSSMVQDLQMIKTKGMLERTEVAQNLVQGTKFNKEEFKTVNKATKEFEKADIKVNEGYSKYMDKSKANAVEVQGINPDFAPPALITRTDAKRKYIALKQADNALGLKASSDTATALKQVATTKLNGLHKLVPKLDITEAAKLQLTKAIERAEVLDAADLKVLKKKMDGIISKDILAENKLFIKPDVAEEVMSGAVKSIKKTHKKARKLAKSTESIKSTLSKKITEKSIFNMRKQFKVARAEIKLMTKKAADIETKALLELEKRAVAESKEALKKSVNNVFYTRDKAFTRKIKALLNKADTVKAIDEAKDLILKQYTKSIVADALKLEKKAVKDYTKIFTGTKGKSGLTKELIKVQKAVSKSIDKHGLHPTVAKVILEKFDTLSKVDVKSLSAIELKAHIKKTLKAFDFYKKQVNKSMAPVLKKRAISDAIVIVKADMINNGGYDSIKKKLEPNTWMGSVYRSMVTLGTNGNQWDILDPNGMADTVLRDIVYTPGNVALGQVDLREAILKETFDSIVKENNLSPKDLVTLGDAGLLNRADKGNYNKFIAHDNIMEEIKKKMGGDYDSELISKLAVESLKEIDEVGYTFKTKIAGYNDKKKYLELTGKKTDINKPELWENIKITKKDYLKIYGEAATLNKILDVKKYIKHSLTLDRYRVWLKNAVKTKKGYSELLGLVKTANREVYKEGNEIIRIYDEANVNSIPKSAEGYIVKGVMTKLDGSPIDDAVVADLFSTVRDAASSARKKSPIKSRNLNETFDNLRPDLLVKRNIGEIMENTYRKDLMYVNMRPVEYEMKGIMASVEATTGATFTEMVMADLKINYTDAYIPDKGPISNFMNMLSRNATFGILGGKFSTMVAQFSALPEWMGTFDNSAQATKYWFKSNAILGGKDSDFVMSAIENVSSEAKVRVGSLSKRGVSAYHTGANELMKEGASEYVSGTVKKAYRKAEELSMKPMQAIDSVLYKRAFVASYLYQLEKANLKVGPYAFEVLNNFKKGSTTKLTNDYLDAFRKAEHQVVDGMGSVNLANQSMFKKIGRLGNAGKKGKAQSLVRATMLFQSFVYNTAFRFFNNGIIKPSKLWKAGDKAGAVKQVVNSVTSEMIGKWMYIENGERVRRLMDLYTGGDGSSKYDDETSILKKTTGEIIQHIPIIGSVAGAFEFSDVKGVPTHIGSTFSLIANLDDTYRNVTEDKSTSSYIWHQMIKQVGVSLGLPGTTQISQLVYKYQNNHMPNIENDRRVAKMVNELRKEQDKLIKKAYINGDDIGTQTPEQILKTMKRLEKRRFTKLMRNILLDTKYDGDVSDEIEDIKKYNNSQKAEWLASKPKEEQAKWISIFKDIGYYTKDFKKKLGLARKDLTKE